MALSLLVVPFAAAPPSVAASSGWPTLCSSYPTGNPPHSTNNQNIRIWSPGAYPFNAFHTTVRFHNSISVCVGDYNAGSEFSFQVLTLQQNGSGTNPNLVQLAMGQYSYKDFFGYHYENVFVFLPADNTGGQFDIVPGLTPIDGHLYAMSINDTGAHWSYEIWDYTYSPGTLLWSQLITNHWGTAQIGWVGAENVDQASTLGPREDNVYVTYMRRTNSPTFYHIGSGYPAATTCTAGQTCYPLSGPFINVLTPPVGLNGYDSDIYTVP